MKIFESKPLQKFSSVAIASEVTPLELPFRYFLALLFSTENKKSMSPKQPVAKSPSERSKTSDASKKIIDCFD